MSVHILKNNHLTLTLKDAGAELTAITDNNTKLEYLWNGDKTYWKRHSPILFPIVGSLKNQCYTFNGQEYTLSQHGFARDMDFEIKSIADSQIWFSLEATEETKRVFPFEFTLEIGYILTQRRITVMWRVINKGNESMYFSIGAHPAFYCPINPEQKQSDYYISFDTNAPLYYRLIDENGLVSTDPRSGSHILNTENGSLSITPDLFDLDALIFENNQCCRISLVNPDKTPYITVTFDAPLFGLWSPAKKNAPFICIEPWYGRCDSHDFNGSLEDREWGNHLAAGNSFETSYTIEIA